MSDSTSGLTQLGEKVLAASSPHDAILETIPWVAPQVALWGEDGEGAQAAGQLAVRLTCPEFTSLCPKTGQPDFATIIIDYQPDALLIESKSFKLFMQSFRNEGMFHERVSAYIGSRLTETLAPIWLRVYAFFLPRGGIPIDVFWQTSQQPSKLYLPPIDIPTFRGR